MTTPGNALDQALAEFKADLRREIKEDMIELMNAQTERLASELRDVLGKPNIKTAPRQPSKPAA